MLRHSNLHLLLLSLTCLAWLAPSSSLADSGTIYFTSAQTTSGLADLHSVNLDGSHLQLKIFENFVQSRGIDVDSTEAKIYFANFSNIRRINLDGSSPEFLVPSPTLQSGTSIHDVAVDPVAGKLYITNRFGGALARMNSDGSNAEEISSPGNDIFRVALDRGSSQVYFTNFSPENFAIFRSDYDGSNPESLATSLWASMVDVDPSSGQIFYLVEDSSTGEVFIRRMNSDGSGITTLVAGIKDVAEGNLPQFRDFIVEPQSGNLIVLDTIAREIFMMGPDGTGRETILGDVDHLRRLTFLPEPHSGMATSVAVLTLLLLKQRRGVGAAIARIRSISRGPRKGQSSPAGA